VGCKVKHVQHSPKGLVCAALDLPDLVCLVLTLLSFNHAYICLSVEQTG
jgi:hypothetical protein